MVCGDVAAPATGRRGAGRSGVTCRTSATPASLSDHGSRWTVRRLHLASIRGAGPLERHTVGVRDDLEAGAGWQVAQLLGSHVGWRPQPTGGARCGESHAS